MPKFIRGLLKSRPFFLENMFEPLGLDSKNPTDSQQLLEALDSMDEIVTNKDRAYCLSERYLLMNSGLISYDSYEKYSNRHDTKPKVYLE